MDLAAASEPASLDTGSAAEAKAAFHLRMRARGIRDLDVLRAFERVPRAPFVPAQYARLAGRDLSIPIGCGQTMVEPWLMARMIEALSVQPSHHVLEIGSGTGYGTAILAQIAARVTGVERFQGLALAAQARLESMAVWNASVAWGDGLELMPPEKRFDRIIVHGQIEVRTGILFEALAEGGLAVAALAIDGEPQRQAICRIGTNGEAVEICRCRMRPLVPGVAAAL